MQFDSMPQPDGFLIESSFVRHRNVLLTRADFGELYVEYYLHLADHQIHHGPEQDQLFKRALAAFALHCASRPRNELTAWTLNFQDPLLNLFLVADNETGAVAGRIFTEHVKESDDNLFFSEVVRNRSPLRRSTVAFQGGDPLAAVEHYYAQSEQRPARLFQTGPESFVMVSAHPDYDTAWYENLNDESIQRLDQEEIVAPLEKRLMRWHCGCNQPRILQVLAPTMRQDPEALFGGEESLRVDCPRCGARHKITRETLEAHVARKT